MRPKLSYLKQRVSVHRRRHVRRIRAASRHPFAVPVAAFAALVVVALVVIAVIAHFRGNPLGPTGNDIVIVSHDHQTQIVPSHERTVGALLKKLNLTINPGDVVEPAQNTAIHQDDFRINIYRASPVQIVDAGVATIHFSAATTPRSITDQAGIQTYSEDALSARPVDNFLAEKAIGNVITIDRSIPVTLDVNGFPAATRTRAKTVGEFLKEKNIVLGKTGQVNPGLSALLTSGQTINVIRDGTGIQSVAESIPMPTQVILDNSLAYGTSAIRQAGSDGQKVQTYRIMVKDGQVISKTLIQEVVTAEPVTEIVVQGTNLSGIKGDMALAGIAPGDYQYADYIISHESGWCPTKAQGEHYCPAIPDNEMTPNGYGLCQATPGYKMQSAGSDWATNPITQLMWCNGYAQAHYGSWYAAYNHWINYHWW